MSARTYEATHPWVNFKVDLSIASYKLWMLLGEARSKCEHIAGAPLQPEEAKRLYEVYLTKGVHATTSIEGNTLSEDEVRRRIEGKLKLLKSREYLGHEVDNVLKVCNEIIGDLGKDPKLSLTPERVAHFNKTVLSGLDVAEDTVPGEFRHHSVGVAGYRGAPAEDCELLTERLCDWLNGDSFKATDPEMTFSLAIIKAVLAHLYIASIHPFGDGNGRTARLIEFQLLVQSGLVPLPAGHLLSNHYNRTRTRYYRELDRTSKSGGDVLPFIHYAVEGFVDGLREQLEYIRQQQYSDMWINYVHVVFRDKDTPANRRQKHLILDMPANPVAPSVITRVSPRVAEDYAGKGEKAVTRDLNVLLKMGLLRREGRAYVANRDVILAFLPPKIDLNESFTTK